MTLCVFVFVTLDGMDVDTHIKVEDFDYLLVS
jgi:hypothetical protein